MPPTTETTKTPAKPKKTPAKRPAMQRGRGKASLGTPAAASDLKLSDIDATHWTNPRGAVDQDSPAFAELVGSVAELGILQPVVVGPALVDSGKHPLVAGWRRFTAATVAGLASIPVRQVSLSTARDALVAALAENVARDGMRPVPEARALQTLMREYGFTQKDAGKAIGMSERTVRERLRILDLSEYVQDAVDQRIVPMDALVTLQLLGAHRPDLADLAVSCVIDGTLETTDITDRQAFLDETLLGLEEQSGKPLHQIVSGIYKAAALFDEDPLLQEVRERWPAGASYPTLTTDVIQRAAAAGKLLTFEWPGRGFPPPCQFVPDTQWLAATLGELLNAVTPAVVEAAPEEARPGLVQTTIPVEKPAAAKPAKPAAPTTDERRLAEARREEIAAYASAGNREVMAALEGMSAANVDDRDFDLVLRLALEMDVRHDVRRLFVDPTVTPGVSFDDREAAVDAYLARHDEPSQRCVMVLKLWLAKALNDARVSGGMWASKPLRRDLVDEALQLAVSAYGLEVPERASRWLAERRRVGDLQTAEQLAGQVITTIGDLADIDPAGPPSKTGDVAGPARPEPLEGFTGKKPTTANVQAAVAAQPGITIPELAAAFGIAQNTLYRVMPTMQGSGLIAKQGRGWHPAAPAKAAA